MQSRKQLDPFKGTPSSKLSLDIPTSSDASSSAADDDIELGTKADPVDTRGNNNLSNANTTSPAPYQNARWGAAYPDQIRLLLSRTLKTRRFEALAKEDIIQFVIVGVLAGVCGPR